MQFEELWNPEKCKLTKLFALLTRPLASGMFSIFGPKRKIMSLSFNMVFCRSDIASITIVSSLLQLLALSKFIIYRVKTLKLCFIVHKLSRESNKTSHLLSDPKSLADFRAGFNQCANEVNRNIMTSEGSDQLREKLLSHLASCCHGNATNRVATSHAPGIPAMTPSFPAIAPNAVWIPYPSPPPSPTSKSAVFIPVANPVQTQMPRIPSPISPSATQAEKINLSPASSPSVTTKTALWRPWWTMNTELNLKC